MEKETGVVTSLQEADMRNYLQEVVAEFRNDILEMERKKNRIGNDKQINERAKSHLVNRLEKAFSASTDETSANNRKITCKFLNSSLSSLEALEKSNQITSTQAAKIREQLVSIISNLNC